MRVVMVPGWQAKVRRHLLRFQHDIAQEVFLDVRRNILADDLFRTGDLLASVNRQGARVYVGTDHWAPLEYGAKPHVIRPSRKKALWWPGLAHPISHANHPGNREYGFMRRAIHKKRG